MEKPVRCRRCPATVTAPLTGAREPGRQPRRDVQPPRVKGNGITMAPRLRLLLIPSILALVLGACAPAASQSPSSSTGLPSASAAPSFQERSVYPLTLTDDAGRRVTLAAAPTRIVSLAPSNTEIVCALDACDRLVGVPQYLVGYPDDVLATVADLPVVVTYGPVDREAIVATEPDLILAAGNEQTPGTDIEALAGLGYPVLVLYPETLAEISADVALVGEALDRGAEAAAVTASMAQRVAAIEEAVAGAERPLTFYEVSIFEGTIYTAGEDSFLASLIEIAGGDPILGDALTTAIALEDLVAADPR